jgi:predicted transcriptional regulator
MSAQNGMLEGYQKGRADLYKKEKDLFETNIKSLREKAKVVSEKARRVAELAAKDPQAAAELSRYISGQEGAEFYLAKADRFGYANAAKGAEETFKAADKLYGEIIKEYARAAKRTGKPQTMKGSDGKLYMVYAEDDVRPVQTPEGVSLTKPTVEKTAKGASSRASSAAGGAVQFRYNQAMTNAGNQLANEIENAASLPISATPPVLAEVLTDPSKSLTEAGKKFFSQKITNEESRAFQQVFAGMTRAITTIEASGRPSGATEGAIREFAKSQPRAGDKKINIYLSLAQSRQVMDILVKDLKAAQANSTQIAQAEEAKKRVDSLITWTVRDVNRIISSGKSTLVDQKVQDAMESSKTLGELNKQVKPSSAKQFATEADADKAFKEGTLKSGDKVIINGQSGTWE